MRNFEPQTRPPPTARPPALSGLARLAPEQPRPDMSDLTRAIVRDSIRRTYAGSMAINKESVKINTDEIKGRAKVAAGAVTGNKDLENEGQIDRYVGQAKKYLDTATDKAKDMLDSGTTQASSWIDKVKSGAEGLIDKVKK